MPLPKDVKSEIIADNKVHDTDTGSTEVQVAVLSERIGSLTEHLRDHPKDHEEHVGGRHRPTVVSAPSPSRIDRLIARPPS